jgi:hypothetical protein
LAAVDDVQGAKTLPEAEKVGERHSQHAAKDRAVDPCMSYDQRLARETIQDLFENRDRPVNQIGKAFTAARPKGNKVFSAPFPFAGKTGLDFGCR